MKKNVRNLIILLAIAAVMCAGYFLIIANENPAQTGLLYQLGNDRIVQVALQNQYGSFVFEQQDGAWVVESNGVYHTNPEKISLLLSCLNEFKITRMLAQERSEYGFDKPQATVSIKTSSGKNYSFVVGAEAIQGASVYIKSNGKVLLTSTGMVSQLTGSLSAYRAKDVLAVNPNTIRSIEYTVKGRKMLSLSNVDYQHWTMRDPFEAQARSVVLNELIGRLRNLIIAEYVDGGSVAQDTGLTSPSSSMVLTDATGTQQKLEFGAVSGNLQYVRVGGEQDVVKLYASDLDFSKLTPQSVMYIAPLDINIAQVQSVSIQAEGKTDLFTLKHGDTDQSEPNITVQHNGEDLSLPDFASVYFKCITLNADGYDTAQPEKDTSAECAAVCTTTLVSGEKVELSLIRRDADTLYLYVNGKPLISGDKRFYLTESSLQQLLYRLRNISQK